MINSINGFDATRIDISHNRSNNSQSSRIEQKDNKEDVKRQIQIYQSRPIKELADEVIKVDESEEGWITKAINQIDDILSKKYTPEQIKTLRAKDPETMEEAVEGMLARYSRLLQSDSIDGKPTIWGKLLGLGTKEEREELIAFKDSLPEGATMSSVGAALLQRTDISIEEFKKLYAEDIEKTTKAHKEAVAKINQEMREYNENLAKQRAETKFKPIQATSKSKTYIDKDIRREFFENFLKAEREKGTDIWSILQKLNKINKVNISA
nr:cell surface protein [uncultured Campylobacter sp.]